MARKRKVKIKAPKTKLGKMISAIAFSLIVVFAVVCYFNPAVYDWVLNLFSGKEEPPFRVEGDTTIVKQEDFRDLEVHFVDVGQGDCIIIKLPDYKNVLIDSGYRNSSEVISYVKNVAKIDTFDYVLATHSDADHVDNMNELFAEFDVKHVFRPYVKATNQNFSFDDAFNLGTANHDTKTYAEFLTAIKNETYGTDNTPATWEFFTDKSDFAGKIKIEETNEVLDYYFDFLSPVKALEQVSYKDLNDYSPIVRFSYQGFDFLFSGDAEAEAETEFITHYATLSNIDYDVEVMKAGHHGSRTSTCQDMLDIFTPEYMVVQCGFGNDYGHPHAEFMQRVTNTGGITLLRNDLHGDIVIKVNKSGQIKDNIYLETPNKYSNDCLYMTGVELENYVNNLSA